jgi:hypothetical protein
MVTAAHSVCPAESTQPRYLRNFRDLRQQIRRSLGVSSFSVCRSPRGKGLSEAAELESWLDRIKGPTCQRCIVRRCRLIGRWGPFARSEEASSAGLSRSREIQVRAKANMAEPILRHGIVLFGNRRKSFSYRGCSLCGDQHCRDGFQVS